MFFLPFARLINVTVNYVFLMNEPSSTLVRKCAYNAESCNQTLKQPCCDPLESCKPTLWNGYEKCVKEAVVGVTCERHEDCFDIYNGECSQEKICVCPPNYVVLNNKTCSPLLNAFCWNDEPCATENSYCRPFRCRCKPGYVSFLDIKCVPKT